MGPEWVAIIALVALFVIGPLRFFEPDGAEVTDRAHRAPPVLGADSAAIRAWLEETR